MLITYPDGFRLGYAPFHNAEYDSSPEAVWRSFTADRGTRHDGITQFVPDTTMRPVRPLRPLNDAEHERVAHDLVRIGAYALRDAVRNLAAWLPFRDVSPEEEHWGCPAIDRMVEANTLGFKDAEAFDRLVNHGGSSVWINDARAAGYHTRDRDSLAWIEAALPWDLRRDGISDAWTEFHPDGWLGLANLRRQGWSLKAAQVLHDQIRDLRSNTEIPVSVVRTRRALLGGGADQLPWVEVDDALYSPVSWIDGDAAEWTKYAGDAATASRLIEGGHRLPNRLA